MTRAILATLQNFMADVTDLMPIKGGEQSQAYRFSSDGRAYVLRLNRAVDGFRKDAFVHRRFACAALPIPEVIAIEEVDGCALCISEAMPGATLQDLAPETLPLTLEPTARVLNAIAESDLSVMRGFGLFDATGTGNFESWRNFLTSIEDCDWQAVRRVMPAYELHRVMHRFKELVPQCPEVRALVHGDFGSNNVLWDGRRITGVIDWSEALIGDPLYDVANIFFWRTWLTCMEQQARYLETQAGRLLDSSNRLLCYQLRIGIGEIYASAIESKPAVAEWAVSRCLDLIS